ncbi:MAG: hypothetical protein HC858_11815 [Brachymonas sp.]|nr:hypothetical protein [Brachymonas sp.]
MQNDINSERNLRRSLLASLVGAAGLGLAGCGGGDPEEVSNVLETASADANEGLERQLATTNTPACNATGGVNTSGFDTKFNDYFKSVMGAANKNGTVYKELDSYYPGQYFSACIDPAAYGGNDGSGKTYTNTAKSEGQGYGMVLAVAANDRYKFDRLWNFTYYQMRRTDTNDAQRGFFDYLVTPYSKDAKGNAKRVGTGIAPDGEIWIATGLIMAWKRWNDTRYRNDAYSILDALKRQYNNLFSGNVPRSWYDSPLTNPSYVNPAFFSYWNAVRPNNGWDKIIAANRKLLVDAANAGGGLAFDWTNFDGTQYYGFSLPTGHGADAVRVAMNAALDTVWTGTTNHKAPSRKAVDKLNGKQDVAEFASAMYATYALTGIGGCDSKVTPYTYRLLNNPLATGYYDGLLCTIACGILSGRIKKF